MFLLLENSNRPLFHLKIAYSLTLTSTLGAEPTEKCKVAADISLIVDASQSVEIGGRIAGISGYFQKVIKEGLKTIVQSFEVSPKDARFSLMLFGDKEPMVCLTILFLIILDLLFLLFMVKAPCICGNHMAFFVPLPCKCHARTLCSNNLISKINT